MEPMQGFRTTVWSRIRQAQSGRSTAINDILLRYRPAVVAFLVRQGAAPEDAEDLAQEVLLQLVQGGALEKADRERGRFRNLVIAVTRNILRMHLRSRGRLKRGGGEKVLSLDAASPEGYPPHETIPDAKEDDEFDLEWARHLFRLAMARLKLDHPSHHEIVRLFLSEDLTYRQIAERIGRTEQAVHNGLKAAKARLAELVRNEIADYSSSGEEYEDEKKRLFRFLAVSDG